MSMTTTDPTRFFGFGEAGNLDFGYYDGYGYDYVKRQSNNYRTLIPKYSIVNDGKNYGVVFEKMTYNEVSEALYHRLEHHYREGSVQSFLDYHFVKFTSNLSEWLDFVEQIISNIDSYEYQTFWGAMPQIVILKIKKQANDWIVEKRKELAELNGQTIANTPPNPQTVEVENKPVPKNGTEFFLILYILGRFLPDFEKFEFNNSTKENRERLSVVANWAIKEFNYPCKIQTLTDYLSKSDKNLVTFQSVDL